MERKIGELFEYNGEWYQCLKSPDGNCTHCDMKFGVRCPISIKECAGIYRIDKKNVIFKKLEKVGEPFTGKVHIQLQRYKIYTEPKINSTENVGYIDEGNTIAIEIKQNKEDMEEEREYSEEEFKNNPRFQHHKNIEQVINMKKVKPFDLEAAKAGKPVCTRDGRKARIICFDRKGYNMFPIVALIMNGDRESDIYTYRPNGTWDNSGNESDKDLMMLPEKKEGWVNVYRDCDGVNITKDDNIYSSKDAAIASAQIIDRDNYVATTIIRWEE